MTATTSARDLAKLPKAHLHLHLEAAMRYETLVELSEPLGLPAPQMVQIQEFEEFARSYFNIVGVLNEGSNLLRAVDEIVEDSAREGVVYLELATLPQFFTPRFGSTEAALDAILEQLHASSEKWGVEAGLMVTVDRADTAEAAVELASLAAARSTKGVVALGLANEERGNPASRFTEAFRIAKAAGLKATPHSGELAGPESIYDSLNALSADRIQHGIRALEDPELVKRLAEERICLDVCPTSNVQLGVVQSMEQHPLPRLIEAGVRCSINADDPTLFGSSLTDEYELCRTTLGLSDEQIADCARASLYASSATTALIDKALAGISSWLST